MDRNALTRPVTYRHALAFASLVAAEATSRTPLGDAWTSLESESPPCRASLRWASRALYAAACARAACDEADHLRAVAARLAAALEAGDAPRAAAGERRRALAGALGALDVANALALVAEHAARGYARAVDAERSGAAAETRRALLGLAFWSRARRWFARALPPTTTRPRRRKAP